MQETRRDRVYICEVVARDGFQNEAVFVETADKMTDPQIAAKVRQYFLN